MILGQGGIAICVAAFGLAVLTIGTLYSAFRGHKGLARNRAMRAATYLLLGLASFATLHFHAATGRKAAQRIIEACEAYEGRYGRLPDRLDQLTPEFLPKIRAARYTVLYNDFWYLSEPRLLSYVVFPPFRRRVYDFGTAKWNYLD